MTELINFLDAPLYDNDLLKLAFRFAHNLFFAALVVRFGLNSHCKDREFEFTAVLLNVCVFFICFTLKKLDIGLGMALGLFAIFGVLRYRTDAIRTKEMTYLFVLIALAVINALTNRKTSYAELMVVNSTIFAAVLLKERMVHRAVQKQPAAPAKPVKHTVIYDKLDMLAPERHEQLVEDLQRRTGIPIAKLQLSQVDLTTSTATITIWQSGGESPEGE
ncbi:MAG: DUF4956 domain-containing protein [Planctomycetales bacterium]|nr:DUF4956 domain-containing protein [Planctomycetales bacterium]